MPHENDTKRVASAAPMNSKASPVPSRLRPVAGHRHQKRIAFEWPRAHQQIASFSKLENAARAVDYQVGEANEPQPTNHDWRSVMEIEHWQAEWGEMNEARMRERLRAEGYAVSRYDYPPGTYFSDHTH